MFCVDELASVFVATTTKTTVTESTSTTVVEGRTVTTKSLKSTTGGVTETKTSVESKDHKLLTLPREVSPVAPRFTCNLDCLLVDEREEATFM